MSRHDSLQRVLDLGLVAIIRAPSAEQLVPVAEALCEGGIDIIEVTFTVPGAAQVIADIRRTLGDRILLGAGSLLDTETARTALLAGAEFIVAPTVNLDVIRLCHRYDKAVMPGAFTPTEVLTAWEAGADIVKIFPADIGGPGHLGALKGPLPQVRMMPTGGVDLDTLPAFIAAGACAVGLGSALVEKDALAAGNTDRIRSLARQYVERIRTARAR
jgi:2-dehydro-3-deoxyphosphogluconate aldolase/(4S)-4-hydroxy-2-oxoglutarate aldolase